MCRGKSTAETARNIWAMCSVDFISERTAQKWFAKSRDDTSNLTQVFYLKLMRPFEDISIGRLPANNS